MAISASQMAQAKVWCTQHFPSAVKTVYINSPQTHGSTSHMSTILNSSITWWVVVVALAYTVGRVGLTTFWSDLKSLFSKVA